MTTSLKVLVTFMATAVLLACGLFTSTNPMPPTQRPATGTLPGGAPAQPPTETLQPLATATSAPQGILVSSANVSLVIPPGLASGAQTETVAAVDEQSGAPWEVSPAYVKIKLQNYPLQGTFFEPQVLIYPAQDYAAVGAGAAISIQRLQAILASAAAPISNDGMPRLPFVNADQIIAAQAKVINFKNGRGLRVLAEYAQNFAAADNHDLFYHFEGLTSDGKYYIVATLPINAAFLAADSDPASPVPTDGIPFPGYGAMDGTTFEHYMQKVADKLNATAADAFTPSLASLDTLIESLSIP